MNEPDSGWPDARIDRALLPHRLADALGDAAMALPVHDQRVDAAPDIVDRGIARDLDGAGLGIDLDLADRAAVREDRVVHLVVGGERELAIGAEPRALPCASSRKSKLRLCGGAENRPSAKVT